MPKGMGRRILITIHKKAMTDCNNYRGITLLAAAYKML